METRCKPRLRALVLATSLLAGSACRGNGDEEEQSEGWVVPGSDSTTGGSPTGSSGYVCRDGGAGDDGDEEQSSEAGSSGFDADGGTRGPGGIASGASAGGVADCAGSGGT